MKFLIFFIGALLSIVVQAEGAYAGHLAANDSRAGNARAYDSRAYDIRFYDSPSEDVHIRCDYAYMGMPTSTVEFTVFGGGKLSSSVTVTMQGSSHKETLTPEQAAEGEYVHGWISKENPENTIELIVYRAALAEGQSKLVNHNVPFAQEMWGTCAGVPDE